MVLNKNTADQRLIFVSLAVVLSGELYHVHHCRSPLIYSYLIRCWLVWHLVLFFCLYFILQALLLFFFLPPQTFWSTFKPCVRASAPTISLSELLDLFIVICN